MKSHKFQNVLTLERAREREEGVKNMKKIEIVVHFCLLIIKHLNLIFFEVKHINCQIYWFSKF